MVTELSWLTPSVAVALAAAGLLGATGALVGSFTLLRRESLLGDALAHASLPGICIAYLLTGSRAPLVLLAGAMLAALVGAGVIVAIRRGSRIKEDAAIGIVLSVFFGLGIVLLTRIQRMELGDKAGLDRFLFGQAASLSRGDLALIAIVFAVVLGATLAFFPLLRVLAFDRDFGRSLGLPMAVVEAGLTLALVAVVVVGLQMVGVILIIATLVTPAAAARQWTDSLGVMLALAAGIGSVSALIGAAISARAAGVPTGPAIVLLSSGVLIVSLLFAPRRGLLAARQRRRRAARTIREENLLKDIYRATEDAGDLAGSVPLALLLGLRRVSPRRLRRTMGLLRRGGLLRDEGDTLRLTDAGRRAAAGVVRRHRLWELYLTRRLELAPDHVHRDAEAMEHVLSEQTVERIDDLLGRPATDPHGRSIPRDEEA